MTLIIEILSYCLLFVLWVKCAVKDNGIHCLYFYPKEYLDKAHERKIVDKNATMKRGYRFILFLCGVLFIVFVFIIANINQVTDFKMAYIQACIFLIVTMVLWSIDYELNIARFGL